MKVVDKMKLDAIDAALICRSLSDANRIQILQMLTTGERCACQLLERFSITQPTLSYHIKILTECELVHVRREGKWNYYSINQDTLRAFRRFIDGLDLDKEPSDDASQVRDRSDRRIDG